MSYAYLDKAGFLHGVEKEEDALKYSANGKVKEIKNECQGGYVCLDVVMCNEDELHLEGNDTDKNIKPVSNLSAHAPELKALYKSLM